MTKFSEIERLNAEAADEQSPGIPLVEINITSSSVDAHTILRRVKEVLNPILAGEVADDSNLEQRESSLPQWFLEQCSPEIDSDAARDLMQTQEGYELLSRMWTLRGFLYWFEPETRSWYWWDARVLADNLLSIRIMVVGHPFASGSLEFLLRSAGADMISFTE